MPQLVRQSFPLANLVDRFFDDSLLGSSLFRGVESNGRTWVPAVDLSQNDQTFVIKADLPGMTKADIHLTVESDTLTLSGERTFVKTENKESFSRVERSYGKFTRSFGLPSNVDATAVKASFADGVLTIEIPKREEAKSRSIEIG